VLYEINVGHPNSTSTDFKVVLAFTGDGPRTVRALDTDRRLLVLSSTMTGRILDVVSWDNPTEANSRIALDDDDDLWVRGARWPANSLQQ
jgi:hypothetical protein